MEVYNLICNSSQELLDYLQYQMLKNKIQQKEIAATLGKDPRSISQIFRVGNPKCQTLFDLVSAANFQMDINFIKKDDTD